ncbi:hypothetical protein PENANT_c040G09170 [Penicillium antarcticum]|uniref:Hydrophobin n=1 Tax=Penicillium antarcticum TaxID=416450 RepID=A0A1V6PSS1_9EURO|nr:hypothetical protein PENANT_c040G09170 [Penicillium antarcticum]
MLMKNIFAAFVLAGLASAVPVDDFEERDIEERDNYCKPENSWCCESVVPLRIFFVEGSGKNCKPKGRYDCPYGRYPLCCEHKQIVGKDGVVCVV